MVSNVIEFQDVSKTYPNGTEALKEIDVSINEGEVVGLIGPNGAGKTTTVKLLLGLLKPTSGIVKLWGEHSYTLSSKTKKRIGFLLEDKGLYENLTVEENVLFWAKVYDADEQEVEKTLKGWNLWNERKMFVKDLSRGMKQRLAIAKAVIHNPHFIVMDEPTSNLDPVSRRTVVDLLKGFAGSDRTIFLTSHDLYDIERICTRVIMIRCGVIIADGSMEELRKQLKVGKEVKITVSRDIEGVLRNNISKRYPITEIKDREILVSGEHCDTKDIVRFLIKNDVDVERVEEKKITLEDIYIEIIKEDEDR